QARSRPRVRRFEAPGSEALQEGVNLALDLLALAPVPLLQATDEQILAPLDRVEVVIRELAPLRANPTLGLPPLSCNLIPIHLGLLGFPNVCSTSTVRCSARANVTGRCGHGGCTTRARNIAASQKEAIVSHWREEPYRARADGRAGVFALTLLR